jgi:hypothetical protein
MKIFYKTQEKIKGKMAFDKIQKLNFGGNPHEKRNKDSGI